MQENTLKILNFLKANNDKDLTAQDVAAALGMDSRQVQGLFTPAIMRRGLGVFVRVENTTAKVLKLTPAGMAYTGDADV